MLPVFNGLFFQGIRIFGCNFPRLFSPSVCDLWATQREVFDGMDLAEGSGVSFLGKVCGAKDGAVMSATLVSSPVSGGASAE